MGRTGVDQLTRLEIPFVLIETNEGLCRELLNDGVLGIQGAAKRYDVLLQAGIQRACGICIVIDSDADNLCITVTTRSLNAKAKIITRASQQRYANAIRNSGADEVIIPGWNRSSRAAGGAPRIPQLELLKQCRKFPKKCAPNGWTLADVRASSPRRRDAGCLRRTDDIESSQSSFAPFQILPRRSAREPFDHRAVQRRVKRKSPSEDVDDFEPRNLSFRTKFDV